MIDDEGLARGVTTANWIDPPFNRWAFRHVCRVARTQRMARGEVVVDLGRAERDLGGFAFGHGGREHGLDDLLAATSTDGLIVLQGGVVVAERYLDGMRAGDRHLLMSVSKSMTGVLCGVLAGRGLLAPDDLVTAHLPELSGTVWDGCRVQHLLDMRAGIAWDYEVDELTILDVSDYRTHGRNDLPAGTEAWIRTIGPGRFRHGQGPFRYASLVTDVLGWVLERAGGKPFPELFSREIWSRLGTEHDAEILVDRYGFPLTEGGICATLRDCARFGLMCLEEGMIAGKRVVPADWVGRLFEPSTELIDAFRSSASADPATPRAMYRDGWWVIDPVRGIVVASGMNGQLMLIHRPAQAVIVKLSTHPGLLDEDLFELEQAGLLALCEHLAETAKSL